MGVSSGTSSSRGVLALRAKRRLAMVNRARLFGTGRRRLTGLAMGRERVTLSVDMESSSDRAGQG